MIPDYKAFVSYKSCQNELVTLHDTTKLPIKGRGTAWFYLNDKVVEVRNALHVPDLRAPLYSLRRHRHMLFVVTILNSGWGHLYHSLHLLLKWMTAKIIWLALKLLDDHPANALKKVTVSSKDMMLSSAI
jgi:hypothetical protein